MNTTKERMIIIGWEKNEDGNDKPILQPESVYCARISRELQSACSHPSTTEDFAGASPEGALAWVQKQHRAAESLHLQKRNTKK